MKTFRLMNHRQLVTVTLIACLLVITAGFKACPKSEKDRNVAYARDIVSGMQAGQRFIDQFKPALSDRWRMATNGAIRLVDVVAASDEEEIVTLLAGIMPVFTEAIAAFTGNTTVLAVLALADIALHFFANHIGKIAARVQHGIAAIRSEAETTALAAIAKFAEQPSFGCDYKPEKCR